MLLDVELDKKWIEEQLQDVKGLRVRFEDTVDSTNTWVLDEHRDIAPGTVLFAERQEAGRGRRGRRWHSPQSLNVYSTLAWSWTHPLERLGGLSSAIGVALVEILTGLGVRGLGVKWPNDVQAHGRKLAGILIESSIYKTEAVRLAIGVGLNVHMTDAASEHSAQAISQPWTAVNALVDQPVSRSCAAAAVARMLHDTLQRFERYGWDEFAPAWRAHDNLYGRIVRTSGATELEGVARGVDAIGALLLDVDGVVHQVHAGEVSVRPVNPFD
jgi:BirA family biotin operon repressor/biotin-[acetyl-CoA-carboxylase] ligase